MQEYHSQTVPAKVETFDPVRDDVRPMNNRSSVYLQSLPAIVLCMAVSLAHAEVYKWTDAAGRTHYGDSPPENAAGLQSVETFECKDKDEVCLADQERRWQQAMEVNREMQDWLDRQQARSQLSKQAAAPKVVLPQTYYAPQAPLVVYPSVLHSSARWRSAEHRHRKRWGIHKPSPVVRPSVGSYRHRARVPSRGGRISFRK